MADKPRTDSLSETVTDFGNATTIHGLQYIVNGGHVVFRLCWILICVAFLTIFILQGSEIFRDFSKNPYSTKIDIVSQSRLVFPAVTVCNANQLRRSQIINTRFEGLIEVDGGVSGADYDYSWWFSSNFFNGYGSSSSSKRSQPSPDAFSWYISNEDVDFEYESENWGSLTDENDWRGFYSHSVADDFSDFFDVVNPTQQEIRNYGHQLQDFVIQCTFDQRQCNITHEFITWQNRYFGNCFTFNSALAGEEARMTGKTGALHGLHLTLFVEQPEYLGILAPQTGAKITVHDPAAMPFPEDESVDLPTGMATSIGVRQENIQRLGGKYGNCTTDGRNTNFSSSSLYQYSSAACRKQCFQLHLNSFCDCVDNPLLLANLSNTCSVLNETQQWCRQYIAERYLDDALTCSCPSPCSETKYLKTISAMGWPSERYEEHLASRLPAGSTAARLFNNSALARKNFIRVKVYYEELNYERVEQIPVYTVTSLLGSVGGLMGLYIGMSFISVFEVMFLILRVGKIVMKKVCCPNAVHPIKT
ncbi:epithelial sodium channel subunit alpha-like [Diadema antillarum]|uniref:epithelial sodium channel subunit alpha-like n=1 Tax=Diadema antillarum TaxID=105358 RepID=UPI003A8AB681